uniref:Uncharacterized protein n=1 Tax=Neobodo designis TaxID=312471 RepID=A0A7S1LZU9_NEODS
MGGKAKPTKHTAKEIQGKAFDATVNRGGGAAGLKDRMGGAAGHARFECPHCGQAAPSLKNMQSHHESKHPKMAWDESVYVDKHELHGGTTKGVAVRGSIYKQGDKK